MNMGNKHAAIGARSLILTILALPLFAFGQGTLTPPGAPAPTMKTLQQIEPRIDLQNAPASAVTTTDENYHFIITQPGSYFLSASLEASKKHGIQINAEGVTLDLNGFEISHISGGGNGIEIPATSHRASIRRGSIKGFDYGINSLFASGNARACEFRNLAVSSCSIAGILTGEGAVLESCRAHGNSGDYGIFAGGGSSLANCTATNNSTTYAIRTAAGSSLTNCTASNNTARYGIFTGTGCSLSNCSASANTSADTTSAGIGVSSGSTISHCTSHENATTAGTPTFSTGMGFDLASSCTIHDSSASFNDGDGINLFADSIARDNMCDSNGAGDDGAGIHAISSDNRIEGNNVSDNNQGIKVDIAGNLIIKNSASGNTTNYEIAASNRYGSIINITAAGAAAVSGSGPDASTLTSTDPWANFSY